MTEIIQLAGKGFYKAIVHMLHMHNAVILI